MCDKFPIMNWGEPDKSESLKLFKQKMNLYFHDEGLKDTELQKWPWKICRGIEDEEQKKNKMQIALVMKKTGIKTHCGNFSKQP